MANMQMTLKVGEIKAILPEGCHNKVDKVTRETTAKLRADLKDIVWSAEPVDIVLFETGEGGLCKIVGLTPGDTVLTCISGQLQATIEITVEGPEKAPEADEILFTPQDPDRAWANRSVELLAQKIAERGASPEQ